MEGDTKQNGTEGLTEEAWEYRDNSSLKIFWIWYRHMKMETFYKKLNK